MKFVSQNLNENNPVYSISSANKCYNHNYKSHTFLSQYYNTYYSSKYSSREFYKNKEVISDLQLIFDDIINYANYFLRYIDICTSLTTANLNLLQVKIMTA